MWIAIDGYPLLQMTVDGVEHLFGWEQKPTLVRHGLVAIDDSKYKASIPGQEFEGVSDDSALFRWVTAFGSACYNATFEEGLASDKIDPRDLDALGKRLAEFARPGSPAWSEIVARLEQTP